MLTNSGRIADEYAAVKIQIEKLEETLKPLKQTISSVAPMLGEATPKGFQITGDHFMVTVTMQSKATLDPKMLMEKFGLTEADLNSCKKESIYDVVRHRAI